MEKQLETSSSSVTVLDRARILLCNDDGIHAQGLLTLAAELSADFDVWIVAPDSDQSARSHSLTLDRPLRLTDVGPKRFSVDGTPADAIYLAINYVLDRKPDLVLSGINHGANIGDDVAYSGTVSAAMEAVFMGVPAVAISLAGDRPFHFGPAAAFARSLVGALLASPLAPRSFLNVNVPPVPPTQIAGLQVTFLSHRRFDYSVEQKTDPRGRHYYWIGGHELAFQDLPGSDWNAIHHNFISVTPLAPDLTDYSTMPSLQWMSALDISP